MAFKFSAMIALSWGDRSLISRICDGKASEASQGRPRSALRLGRISCSECGVKNVATRSTVDPGEQAERYGPDLDLLLTAAKLLI